MYLYTHPFTLWRLNATSSMLILLSEYWPSLRTCFGLILFWYSKFPFLSAYTAVSFTTSFRYAHTVASLISSLRPL